MFSTRVDQATVEGAKLAFHALRLELQRAAEALEAAAYQLRDGAGLAAEASQAMDACRRAREAAGVEGR